MPLMLTHRAIWKAIDGLATRYGYTPSGLARQAGLDPTAFNKSKRFGPSGRPRWPSTESIAAILKATGAGFGEFTALTGSPSGRPIPVTTLAKAQKPGAFDAKGRPQGKGWKTAALGHGDDDDAFAVEISGTTFAPLFREGEKIVVSPGGTVKAGDRVLAMTAGGELMLREVAKTQAKSVKLTPVGGRKGEKTYEKGELAWIARIGAVIVG